MSDKAQLVKYNAACRAIAEARRVDEVKLIRDKAAAMAAAAKIAKNHGLEIDAAEIRIRAERRLGEMIAAQKATVGLNRGAAAGGKKDSPRGVYTTPRDSNPTLAQAGIDKNLAKRARSMAAIPQETFEATLAEHREAQEAVTARTMERLADVSRRTARAEEKATATKKAQAWINARRERDLASVCDLRVCSCAELFASGIKPDAVITDPPYPKEFMPVYSELAKACARVPLVAVMVGQLYLPEVMRRLCEHLRYRWTLAYLTPGGQAVQQWQSKVNSAWKPVLLFGESAEWLGDVASSKPNDNDKRFHHWGQSESGMADLVERLTKPGWLVCDPFLGGGTTAVVSLAMGRSFVGCDIDAACVDKSRARVEVSHA